MKCKYCEMKRKGGKLTHDQSKIHEKLEKLGQKVIIAYGFEDFKLKLIGHLKNEFPKYANDNIINSCGHFRMDHGTALF